MFGFINSAETRGGRSLDSVPGVPAGTRTRNLLLRRHDRVLRTLNKLPVSQAAELTGLSKSYISQVRHGNRPPSQRLIDAILQLPCHKEPDFRHFSAFMDSRRAMGVSPKTLMFYKYTLLRFVDTVDYLRATRHQIERYLQAIPPNKNGLGTRHASYRALKTFYRWLSTEYSLENPMQGMPAPILGKPILPAFSREQVEFLMASADCDRDKAIIALFTESGLRLSELASIRACDINWQDKTIKRVMAKGRKAALAAFGGLSEGYLMAWLANYQPNGSCIWGLNYWGITMMLKRLREKTGLPCNPHTFRRTFAVLLRKAGVDCLTIRDLGRWESVSMVERYTRSFGFSDAMRFYRGPLS